MEMRTEAFKSSLNITAFILCFVVIVVKDGWSRFFCVAFLHYYLSFQALVLSMCYLILNESVDHTHNSYKHKFLIIQVAGQQSAIQQKHSE